MTDALPSPLTPADADLRAFPFTPVFRSRLFGSSFHARVNDSQWRAGVTLWLKSWDQVPAGSLPDDDIDLCRLAELGRDLRAWKRHRDGALRGWILCSDGRLYHPVVAEGINEALDGKRKQHEKTLAARIGAMKKRLADAKTDEARASMTAEIESMSQTLSHLQSQKAPPSVTDSVTGSVTSTNRERKGEGQGKREGQGEGKGKGKGLLPSSHTSAAPEARAGESVDPTTPFPKGKLSPEAALAIPLREVGVKVTSMHPVLVGWVRDGFTVEQALGAVAIARESKSEGDIPANYLDTILRNPHQPRANGSFNHARRPGAPTTHADVMAALDAAVDPNSEDFP